MDRVPESNVIEGRFPQARRQAMSPSAGVPIGQPTQDPEAPLRPLGVIHALVETVRIRRAIRRADFQAGRRHIDQLRVALVEALDGKAERLLRGLLCEFEARISRLEGDLPCALRVLASAGRYYQNGPAVLACRVHRSVDAIQSEMRRSLPG